MKTENKGCNGLEHVPTCSTWPPPWLAALTLPTLAPATPPRLAAEAERLEPPSPDVSPWDLPPDVYERWEERVCIMHFDGRLPWKQAEVLALADVLGNADPPDGERTAGRGPEAAKDQQLAPMVQSKLFQVYENGPY